MPLSVRTRRDKEFLPAALEIIETPPSPVMLVLLAAICLLFSCALAWSYFARVDVVAIASGKVQPQGRVKTIQPVETGRVTSIAVSNGTYVAADSLLLSLDPAVSQAETAELSASLAASKAEVVRRQAAIRLARGSSKPAIDWPEGTLPSLRRREEDVLAYDLGQLRATVANLQAQITQKRAEGKRLESTIAAQTALVAILQERVDMRSLLMSTGSTAKASVIDAKETFQSQAATLAYQIGQRDENRAAITVIESDIDKTFETFIADNGQKAATAERQGDNYDDKLVKARASAANLAIYAPVAGVVQALKVTTVGQVVTVGDEIMRIVPEGTRLEIEAYLPNRDIGFVELGQEAVIKVESFPFTRYGTLLGTVARVANDAIPQPDADMAERSPAGVSRDSHVAGGQTTQGLVFPITIALGSVSIDADGKKVPLSPGMAVTVEIKTGTRRIISYLMSPLIDVSSSAMHER